jgi:hypothetical protein
VEEVSAKPAAAALRIQDYQDREQGGTIPEWVDRYLAEGLRGVERLDAFRDRYVFISLNEGTNFKALSQWSAAFSPAQDFARLAAARIEARLTAAAVTPFPDDTFGPFFEAMIKTASDAQFPGAVKEADFWIQQESAEAESEDNGVIREVYDFLVLASIGRDQLESQISVIFTAARANLVLHRNQTAAINRLRDSFFDGF